MNNPHPHLPAEGKRTPISTYRLQVNENFPFSAAEEVLPYLVDLGVTDVYLSPILQAAPGSLHGYDVVDHTHISVQLGGLEAFKAFSDRAHELGLHVIVDIVPNHMADPHPYGTTKPCGPCLNTAPSQATRTGSTLTSTPPY